LKDRLFVSFSDVNGTKTFNVNKVIKKVLFWTVLIIFLVLTISFFLINHLSNSVNQLTSQSIMLKEQNEKYSEDIVAKKEHIKQLGDRLEDIEEIIGLELDEDISMTKRATIAKLTLAEKKYMLQTIPSGCPIDECVTTSKFGWRTHPVTRKKQYHKGLDLRAARRTPVYATADGVVRYVQDKNIGTFGRVIIITHNFGFETIFGHLRFTHVKVGDVIKKGQLIGKSGNSGRSNGPHLHYEVRYASKLHNPRSFVDWNMKNYDQLFDKERRIKWESLVNLISNQNKVMAQQ
jgi:murein DD-endopeptidase MepM/ murein hydrolase activator NlpD